jgi:hypothetical protein
MVEPVPIFSKIFAFRVEDEDLEVSSAFRTEGEKTNQSIVMAKC